VTHEKRQYNYLALIIVLRLRLNDAQPLITCQNTSRIDFPSTAVLPPYYGAYGRPGSNASGYRVIPPECGVDNVPRAMPRKLCFSIFGVPAELGAYSR
jgi:hypothetical protein